MFKIFKITKDTYISQRFPDENNGMEAQLYITSSSYNSGTKLNPHEDKRTLVSFNTNKIIDNIGSGNIEDYDFKLRFYISDLRLVYNHFSVNAYPITKSWDEGIGEEFNTNIGSSWKYAGVQSQYRFDESEGFEFIEDSNLNKWDNYGGDYDSGSLYSSSIDKNKMILETDITNYVNSINSGSEDNGLIYIADKINYNMAMYSSDSFSEIHPVVVAYKDDYVVSGSAKEFDGDSSNIYIKSLNYKRVITKGQQFNMLLNIESQYREAGFTYDRELNYVENMKYKLVYDSFDYDFIPYSDFTKVPVKGEGLTIDFSTENFPRGSYYIQCRYKDPNSGSKTYSDKFYFRVE